MRAGREGKERRVRVESEKTAEKEEIERGNRKEGRGRKWKERGREEWKRRPQVNNPH